MTPVLSDVVGVHAQGPLQVRLLVVIHAIVHGPPLGPRYPALQVQSGMTVLPVSEFEFAGQFRHKPELFRYCAPKFQFALKPGPK